MAARAGTPLDVRECLQQAFARALRADGVVDRLAAVGADAVARTPAQFADDLRRDFDRMSAVIRAANIRL